MGPAITADKLRIDCGAVNVAAEWWYNEDDEQWQCKFYAAGKYEGEDAPLNEAQAAEIAAFLESPPTRGD